MAAMCTHCVVKYDLIVTSQHRSESGLQKIVTTFLASSALVAGFPNLASLARLQWSYL